ncbi:MAG: amphi-Trp domain-containing protein [Chloroflexota bacterium]
MPKKRERDVEKVYSIQDFATKMRRLIDALEEDQPFEIQVAGERIYIPAGSSITIEHERGEDEEELEFQIKWPRSKSEAKKKD